jgi:hypothetical protein
MKYLPDFYKFLIVLFFLPAAVSAKNTPPNIQLKHENFEVSYSETGVLFNPAGNPIDWNWQLNRISGLNEMSGNKVVPVAIGNDVRYSRGNITEQYLFRGNSIEQQFIIHNPREGTDDLIIEGSVSSKGTFTRVYGGWTWSEGDSKVYLGDVYVYDASGKQIAAQMDVTCNSTRITVDGTALKNATYPVTIDPQIGPDDFVLVNAGIRLYQPRLIYNPTDQKFFSSWTNYDSSLGRKDNIYGASYDLAQIRSAHVPVNGNPGYGNFTISKTPASAATNSSATSSDVAATKSSYLTVWEDLKGAALSNKGIKYRISTKTATSTDTIPIFKSSAFRTRFGWPENPAVASDDSKFLITASTALINTNYYVLGKYITEAGASQSTDSLTLMSSSVPFADTDVDARPAGSFYVAAATLNQLYFGIAPATGSLTPNSQGVTGNIGSIAIAAGSTQALLVWSESSTGKYIIKGMWINNAGVATGGSFQIDPTDLNGSGHPSVAYNPDTNSWVVVWDSTPFATPGTIILGREIQAGGTMNNVFPVSNQARTSVSPTVAYDTTNKEFWIAWSGGGNKDQLIAQRWKSSLADCIINFRQDTIRENNFKKAALNKSTDIRITTLFAMTSANDSIYPVDFIPSLPDTLQTSYLSTSVSLVKPTGTLASFHSARNQLFYVLNDSIDYEKFNIFKTSYSAQSETPGAAGQSSKQFKNIRVVDHNEQFSAVVPATITFLEDQLNVKIPFTFNSGDIGKERNSISLSLDSIPPITFLANPTLKVNPSVPGGGHADPFPRTPITVKDTLLVSLKPNANGTGRLKITLTDLKGGAWSSVQKDNSTVFRTSVTITPVNDAPTFTPGSNVDLNEDAGAKTVSSWATGISTGPADEGGQALSFTVTNNNNALFSVQPSINATTGTLTFTSGSQLSGVANVRVRLGDNGGIANGGIDSSSVVNFTITVNPVNDVPSFTAGTDQSVYEDSGAHIVSGWAQSMSSGPANESSQVLTFSVTNDNSALFTVQPSVDATGTLSYTPKADAFGSATVSVKLSDDGGTANSGIDQVTKTFILTISPVNDVPSFSAGTDQTASNDAGAQTVPGWASAISAGPANESAQTLTFQVTNTDNFH